MPPGGATIVEFRAEVPSTIMLVDHAISRVFNKGAVAQIKVSGPENRQVYHKGAHNATVAAHGMTKTYPVTFEVLETKDDRIRIKGEHTFSRIDFGIGSDPAQNPEEQVGTDVTIQMVLTLVKS